jgi:hypothetical protein
MIVLLGFLAVMVYLCVGAVVIGALVKYTDTLHTDSTAIGWGIVVWPMILIFAAITDLPVYIYRKVSGRK